MFNFLKILKNCSKLGNNFYSNLNIFSSFNSYRVLLFTKKNVFIYVFIKSGYLKKKFIKIVKYNVGVWHFFSLAITLLIVPFFI